VTAGVLVAVAVFSLFVATIPGEPVDKFAGSGQTGRDAAPGGRYVFGYAVPAVGGGASNDAVLGLFHRNLQVVDQDLVVDKDVTLGEPTLNLRNRDLRFARFDRTDLHQADMTGSDLEGASLVAADLRGVWMQCGNLDELLLTDNRRASRCTSARSADFYKARMTDAKMAGVDLSGARLEEAQLEGADLSHGLMIGADLASARLDQASFGGGVALQGANLLLASLQGADLSGAKLQMADLANASLTGANLTLASLEGAVLRDAELDGANLQMSRLVGADLRGAKLQGADMTGAVVWRALPPGGEISAATDMAQIILQAPTDAELATLSAAVSSLAGGPVKTRMAEGLAPLLDPAQNARWASSPDQQTWQGLAKASETAMADGYKARLTEFLTKLMCRARFGNGAVASGVARRAMAQGFKGDTAAVYDRLKSSVDCPAATAMSPRLMRDLGTAADLVRTP
jgi:uncharacterized protein YjbI with pentapeptide repeats